MEAKDSQGAKSGRSVRIGDVAAKAGVSTATVSRTLAFPDKVRPATRQRVMEAVDRLGYTPNEAARALRAGASRMVLVVIPQDYSGAFFAGVIRGADAELSAHGYTILMGSLDGDAGKARRLVDLVFARQIDGAIVLSGAPPSVEGRSILSAGVPVIAVCAEIDGAQLPAALVDDFACAQIQTQHLLDLGHRRLHYISGIEGSYNEVQRYRGFLAAAARAGIGADAVSRSLGNYSLASGAAAAHEFLRQPQRATGIVACSDEMAIAFLKTINQAGVKCPGDVSIVGFDDIEFASFCEPALTTIRQPSHALGATGAAMLLAALRGEADAASLRAVFPGELIIRGSTGPAPAF